MSRMRDGGARLNPLGLGGILDRLLPLYGRGFLKLVVVAAVFQILAYFAPVLMSPLLYRYGTFLAAPFFLFLGVMLFLVVNMVLYGTLVHLLANLHLGREATLSDAVARTRRSFSQLLGVSFLVVLAVLGMAVTVVGIPFAVYFAVRWAFAVPAVVLEGAGATEAMSRSSELVRNGWWRVFAACLPFVLLVSGIQFVVSMPFVFLQSFSPDLWSLQVLTITQVVSLLINVLLVPLGAVLLTLLYYDLRARRYSLSIATAVGELDVQ